MKTFKQSIQDDISNIFFDLKLFGEIHLIDGDKINIIIDYDELTRRNGSQSANADGVFIEGLLFFADIKDFGRLPEAGSLLKLDESIYRVSEVTENSGVLEVVLEANIS